MAHKNNALKFKAKTLFLFFLSVILLFIGFKSNGFHVAEQQWFESFQHDIDGLVLGRIVKSNRDGMFSSGGLAGYALPGEPGEFDEEALLNYQYKIYLQGLDFDGYKPYKSHIGGQAMLFSLLDHMLAHTPAPEKLNIFRSINSFLAALAISAIVLWFYQEFGLTVGLFVLASAVFSQWLLVFGRLIWWSFWVFYLPMIVLMYYLKRNMPVSKSQYGKFAAIVFVVVLIKCFFAGYEYMTTTLIMMVVPFVYFGVLRRINFTGYLKGFLAAILGSLLAILLSFTILSFQISTVEGSFMDGVNHIIYSYEKRTYADPADTPAVIEETVHASRIGLVYNYMNGLFFDANNFIKTSNPFLTNFLFKVKYLYLILGFFVMSAYLYYLRGKHDSRTGNQQSLALILATWFAISAPLSWYIVFKAHSYAHQHLNCVVWQMPFTFFGFALLGLTVKSFMPQRQESQDLLS